MYQNEIVYDNRQLNVLLWDVYGVMPVKGLVSVGREPRQQHPSDVLSGEGNSDSAARGTSPPESALWGCCWHNSRQTVINPDYSMTKQPCTKCIYDKIHSKSNRATLPTCFFCNVTHIFLTTGVAALHIPSCRVRDREERRQAPTESLFYSPIHIFSLAVNLKKTALMKIMVNFSFVLIYYQDPHHV